ncbi:MAG: GNAT family N-acetyltransferase [Lachnospiraceae bacterium]|nr:GNAT family N-acetyltransferase [Lachnospiraceae bacterium]
MQIIDFTVAHIEQAAKIAKQNYETQRGFIPTLPPIKTTPDLMPFAENNFGVAAFDGNTMLGFLCCRNPWDDAWSIPGLRHVFSPMGANGTIPENRTKIYAGLYQAAAAKWVSRGIGSHGICLYAHDTMGQSLFFKYGFGKRTVDAIRDIDEIIAPLCNEYILSELEPENILNILPLDNLHVSDYIDSPFFMYRESCREEKFLKDYHEFKPIYFVARKEGQIVAYIKAECGGETFIQDTPGYLHCTGLYCLPEHRGKGIGQNLLNLLLQKLKTQNYTRLGVDFESINPLGSKFWEKYFETYTYGVVRRIDESAVIL